MSRLSHLCKSKFCKCKPFISTISIGATDTYLNISSQKHNKEAVKIKHFLYFNSCLIILRLSKCNPLFSATCVHFLLSGLGWNRFQSVPQLALHPRGKRLYPITRSGSGFRGWNEAEGECGVSGQPLHAAEIVTQVPDETASPLQELYFLCRLCYSCSFETHFQI